MSTTSTSPTVGEKTATKRTDYILDRRGNAVGANWQVPKADFARFLGFAPPTPQEMRGEVSGTRVIEVELMRQAHSLGVGAAGKRGNAYAAFYGAIDSSDPSKVHETLLDVRDALREGAEKNSMERRGLAMGAAATEQYMAQVQRMQQDAHTDNVRYLEMQYKFEELCRQDTVMSNLMKARHESVTRTIRGNGG